ncbi:MAG TPA: hypothetical protein VFO37_00785, partial [Chitinophagaceae bacterium]|nr:hypothetical protein [Chitinophagaceae bacterium]
MRQQLNFTTGGILICSISNFETDMRPLYFLIWTLPAFICCSTEQKNSDPKWKLVWSDDFGYAGLPDSTKWNYDVGGHGWGNNELQFYTNQRLENARVEKG